MPAPGRARRALDDTEGGVGGGGGGRVAATSSEDPRCALDDIEVGGWAGPGPLEGVRDRWEARRCRMVVGRAAGVPHAGRITLNRKRFNVIGRAIRLNR